MSSHPKKPSIHKINSSCWQVQATVSGVRHKKRFLTEEEARAYVTTLLSEAASLPFQPTVLTAAQLRDAEAACFLLGSQGPTLRDSVAWFLANRRAPSSASWETAIDDYLRVRAPHVSAARARKLVACVRTFAATVGPTIGSPTADQVKSWLASRGDITASTHNHLRADLSTFMSWCVKRGTIPVNVASHVAPRKRVRSVPSFLEPEAAVALMRDLEVHNPAWVPAVAMMLFGGVRSDMRDGEIRRLDYDLRSGHCVYKGGIEIRGKTGVRFLPWIACGPLEKWLEAYPPSSGILPSMARAERDWTKIRKRHGLPKDVLRNTAVACMCYNGMSCAEVSLALGLSAPMLRHYLGQWSPEMTQAVHAILPIFTAGNRFGGTR